jgi:hypothetical protein
MTRTPVARGAHVLRQGVRIPTGPHGCPEIVEDPLARMAPDVMEELAPRELVGELVERTEAPGACGDGATISGRSTNPCVIHGDSRVTAPSSALRVRA